LPFAGLSRPRTACYSERGFVRGGSTDHPVR